MFVQKKTHPWFKAAVDAFFIFDVPLKINMLDIGGSLINLHNIGGRIRIWY